MSRKSAHVFTPTATSLEFLIERQIGYGAQAEVFQATSSDSRHPFAVKVFNDEKTYQRETNALAYLGRMAKQGSFEPAFVVSPSSYGEIHFSNSQPHFAITMPIHGEALTRRLHEILSLKKNQRTHQAYQEEVYKLFFCLVGMLDTLHKAGIYNPDLTPKNILQAFKKDTTEIDETRPWVLVDFACAQPYRTFGMSEQIMGPALYLAPELQKPGAARTSSAFAAMVWATSQILAQVLDVSFAYDRKGWLPKIGLTHTKEHHVPKMTADMLKQRLTGESSGDFYTFMLSVMSAMEQDEACERPGIALLRLAATTAMRLKDTVSQKLEPETVYSSSDTDEVFSTESPLLTSSTRFTTFHHYKIRRDPPPLPRWEKTPIDSHSTEVMLGKNNTVLLEARRFF